MLGAALKAHAPAVCYAIERWSQVADEAQEIGAEHFAEVEYGLDPRRKWRLSAHLMSALDAIGASLIVTARVDGVLAGYFTWQITEDVESEGLLIAQQGAWFVRAAYSDYHLGLALLKLSISELKTRGVKCIFRTTDYRAAEFV